VKIVHVNLKGEIKKPNGKIIKVVYYVMKFAEYGELFEILQQTTSFSERIARYYFRQLAQSVEHLHKHSIGHRDIKTENILIDHKFNLKLADFGCACKSRDHKLQRIGFDNQTPIGSPEYNAPEITNNSIPNEYFAEDADVFASASTLFVMVLQSIPFNSSLFNDPYYSRLCKKDTSKFWKIFDTGNTLTYEFKDLIEKMMDPIPQKRITIDEIKKHPWYQGSLPSYEEVAAEMRKRGEIILIENQEKFRNYHNKKLRKTSESSHKSSMSNFKSVPDLEVENLRQLMQSTVHEINLKLMREAEEREMKKINEKAIEPNYESNKIKGRRRSTEEKLSKDKPKLLPFVGQNELGDESKMFMNESYIPEDTPNLGTNRQFPLLRKNSSKEDRIRIRRSGSDD
jgi:serine/threonine protein kinase